MAKASSGSFAQLWRATDLKMVRTLSKTAWSGGVSFTPDASAVVYYTENQIQAFDLNTYAIRWTINNLAKPFSISSDSTKMVVAANSISIYSCANGGLIQTIVPGGMVYGAVFIPGSDRVAVSQGQPSVKIFDASTTALVDTIPIQVAGEASWSPDGSILAILNTKVDLYSAASKSFIRSLTPISGNTVRVEFDPTGRSIAVGGVDGSIRVFDVQSGALLRSIQAAPTSNSSLAYSHDGNHIFACGGDRIVKRFSLVDNEVISDINRFLYAVTKVASDGLDGRVLTSSTNRGVDAWEATTGKYLYRQPSANGLVDLAASRDGNLFANLGNFQLQLRQASDGALRSTMAVASNNGRILFTADSSKLIFHYDTIKVIDASNGSVLLTVPGVDYRGSLALNEAGTMAAVASTDVIRLFNLTTGAAAGTISVPGAQAKAIFFSESDDALYCIYSGNTNIKVRISDGAILQSFSSQAFTTVAAMSADRKYLALAGYAAPIHWVKLPEFQLLSTTHQEVGEKANSVAFVDGSSKLAVARYDGILTVVRNPHEPATKLLAALLIDTAELPKLALGRPATLTIWRDTGEFVATQPATIRKNGHIDPIVLPDATSDYWLDIKVDKCLVKRTYLDAPGFETSLTTIKLTVGDIDGDNAVGLFDYLILSDAFDTSTGDAGFEERADLDEDGTISLFDYLILSNNFDMQGD